MSSFTQPLTVTKIGTKLWCVYIGFRYYVGAENSSNYIDVPSGFITDFASVPQLFWNLLPPDGRYTQAAVLHDYLYRSQLRSKKESDSIFLEAMTILDVPAWKRWVMYQSVNMFGTFAWNKWKRIKENKNV